LYTQWLSEAFDIREDIKLRILHIKGSARCELTQLRASCCTIKYKSQSIVTHVYHK